MPRPRRRRAGFGDYYTENCGNDHSLSWLNPFCYGYLNRDISKATSAVINSGFPAPPLPLPVARPIDYVPTGAVDVAGNPVYEVVTETPQQNQAANAAQFQEFMTRVADANAPDCTAWYNQTFNSDCGGSMLLLYGGLGLLAIAVLPALIKRGRG